MSSISHYTWRDSIVACICININWDSSLLHTYSPELYNCLHLRCHQQPNALGLVQPTALPNPSMTYTTSIGARRCAGLYADYGLNEHLVLWRLAAYPDQCNALVEGWAANMQ